MKKITFRAECFVDITAFLQLLMYNDIPYEKLPKEIGNFTIDNDTLVCSFMVSDDDEIDFFKNISSNIIDNHRICQTMRFGDKPNEKWYKDAPFKKLYKVKTNVLVDRLLRYDNHEESVKMVTGTKSYLI